MDTLVSLYAGASGLWKKFAVYLPLVGGAGTLLIGLGGLLGDVSRAANAGQLLALLQNLQNDPNAALVLAGLTALGLHTNHAANKAAIAAATAVPLPNAQKP